MPRGQFWGNPEKVAQWMSARPTRNPIIEVLREGFDFGDMHASTVGILFAIADVMTDVGSAVPAEWEFRQSPFGSDTDSSDYQDIVTALEDGSATLEDLDHAGKVFERLDSLNRLTGIAY